MHAACATGRRPFAVEPMIPLAAAGRQPLFFFGTLMDLDVLANVLARPVDVEDLQPAFIDGFCRSGTPAGSYPILVPCPGRVLEGRLLRRVNRRDIARINHYESGEYRAALHAVTDGRGRERAAWLYLALDRLETTGESWDLAAWQCCHKPGFFAACDGWMANFIEQGCDSNSPDR